jgi:hypothetical protein
MRLLLFSAAVFWVFGKVRSRRGEPTSYAGALLTQKRTSRPLIKWRSDLANATDEGVSLAAEHFRRRSLY